MTGNFDGILIPAGGAWEPGPATRMGQEQIRYTNGNDTAETYWHRTEIGSRYGSNYCPESSLIAWGTHLLENES
jgi:hypothetical protein